MAYSRWLNLGRDQMQTTLSPRRRSIHPQADDTWQSIAQREMPKQPTDNAIAQLQSWNLHVFARRVIDDATGKWVTVLPSIFIFGTRL